MSCFRFIVAEKTNYPISLMCRVLGVSRSGFHAWARRPPSARALADAALTERIRGMYARSRDSYGSRRISSTCARRASGWAASGSSG